MILKKEFASPAAPEIHLWRIFPASGDKGNFRSFYDAISGDERRRSEKFRRAEDRTDFVVRRAALRDILSRYTGVKSKEIEFAYDSFGKPSLAARTNHKNIDFNLSQTRGAAVCAVLFGQNVGADIEAIDENDKNLEIAARFFSETEKTNLRLMKIAERETAFYRCWTRKEAVLKALGLGLSHPLDSFTVSTGAEFRSPVSFADETFANQNWRTMTFAFGSKFIASIAFENICPLPPRLRFFDWSAPQTSHAPTVSLAALDFGASLKRAGLFSRP